MEFTIDDYREWPDSFEQSARTRAEREARRLQMRLYTLDMLIPVENQEVSRERAA
jgi:hypothetical protein